MTNPYDKAAQESGDAVFAEFADDINELKTTNIAEMFPNPTDRMQAEELIAAVDKATSKNDLANAFKAFGAKATTEGLKAAMEGLKIAKKVML